MIKEVHICDRCGEVFEPVGCFLEGATCYSPTRFMQHTGDGEYVVLELCHECQEEYSKMVSAWMQGGVKHDTQRGFKTLLSRKSKTKG